MTSPDNPQEPGPFLPHGGYRRLRSYIVAQAVYDATIVFCRRFCPRDPRLADQMVQAARSGVRNISEGSGAAATSRRTEMKLTNVARASLADELLPDYESFLTQNRLPLWPKDSPRGRAMRERLRQDRDPRLPPPPPGGTRLTGLAGLPEFVARADPEVVGNAMVCAVHQAVYLLNRQLASQGRAFLEQGGFTEGLSRHRRLARDASAPSAASDSSDPGTRPPCPECGQPTRQPLARQGGRPGLSFWGCSRYPQCAATRPMEPGGQAPHPPALGSPVSRARSRTPPACADAPPPAQ